MAELDGGGGGKKSKKAEKANVESGPTLYGKRESLLGTQG